MAGYSRAVHKLESAVEKVSDVRRMEIQANSDDDEHDKQTRFTPAQVRDMIYSFEVFDRNQDKVLDIDELAMVFRVCGQNPSKKQLQDIADEADADGNGVLDQKEYITLLTNHMHSSDQVKTEMKEAFAVFDRNGDGKVDKKELKRVLQTCDEPLTSEEVDELITLMDDDKDGYIDINEFTNFLCNGTAIKDIKTEKRKHKTKEPT